MFEAVDIIMSSSSVSWDEETAWRMDGYGVINYLIKENKSRADST